MPGSCSRNTGPTHFYELDPCEPLTALWSTAEPSTDALPHSLSEKLFVLLFSKTFSNQIINSSLFISGQSKEKKSNYISMCLANE